MRLLKVVSVLNSEVTRLTGKKPVEAIKKKVVDAKSSTTNFKTSIKYNNQELMVPSALDRDIFSTDSAIHQTSQGLDK